MNAGVHIRMRRLFGPDGRSLVVAMDHGLPGIGPLAHLGQPAELLAVVADAGADAVLTTPGIAAHFPGAFGHLGLILRLDGAATTLSSGGSEMRLIASVEDALRLGADAVALMGFPGAPEESNNLETLGQVAVECRRLGVPLMAEMLPLGYMGKPNVGQLATAVRIGAELGANLIKTKYLGPAEAFRAVTADCFAPVLVLGGSSRSPEEVVQDVREALSAGAAGAVIGRNIWQAADPGAVTRLLAYTVHPAG